MNASYLIATGIVSSVLVTNLNAFARSELPKVVASTPGRGVSITPIARSDGELAPPRDVTSSEQLGVSSDTILEVFVDARGAVTGVTVLKSSGSRKLDLASIENARENWKFLPAIRNGVAVPSKRVETVRWSSH